ncbi:MAG: histidine kinase [Bacteroidota bacterium]
MDHLLGLPRSKNVELEFGGEYDLFLCYENEELWHYNLADGSINNILLPKLTHSTTEPLYYDFENNQLLGKYFYLKNGEVNPSSCYDTIQDKIITPCGLGVTSFHPYNEDTLLVTSHGSPGMISKSLHYWLPDKSLDYYKPGTGNRVFTYRILPDGTHLVGGLHGLYFYENFDTLIPTNLGFPELEVRVEDMIVLEDSSIVFGTRGRGIIRYFGDSIWVIDQAAGLASDMVRDLHQTDDGSIWVSTFSGASKVIFSNAVSGDAIYSIRNFNIAHGLPSNEIHEIDSWENQVWMATSGGLVKFVEPPVDTNSAPPSIRGFWVNGERWALDTTLDLRPSQDNVELEYSTINFRMLGRILYRYRLNQDDEWTYTQQRKLNYPQLAAGAYQFEVQSQNEDGLWSASTLLPFRIARVWYARWWAQLMGILLIVSGLVLYFRRSIAQRERAVSLQNQMQELERSALSAQMNPHFIFNCLNSINNFILDNDATQASLYLSRFAKLIRKTLNVSVAGTHTLEDEINMLEGYLELEKLRFKNEIEYRIEIDPALDTLNTQLPPLLIQPFVENALVHGLSNRPEVGRIIISFDLREEETANNKCAVLVTVEDNGHGMVKTKQRVQKRPSHGMRITNKRLDLLSEKDGKARVKLIDLKQKEGRSGTRIEILIEASMS